MIFEEFLSKAIHENFDTLLGRFGLHYLSWDEGSRDIYYYYIKSNLLVTVHYNYPNEYLDVFLYRETDLNKRIGADFVSLEHIMMDKIPSYDYREYKKMMPRAIPIEQSVEKVSKLVEQYAVTYLEGKEWKTWRDIMR